MGYKLFLVLLNMSLTGALVISAVLVVRLLLHRAPKIISYCLWAVVLFKLLCPVSFSLPLRLPDMGSGPVVESGIVYYIPKDILYGQTPVTEPEIPALTEGGNAAQSGETVTAAVLLLANPQSGKYGEGENSSQGQENENVGLGADNMQEPDAEEPEEENRRLRAMERGEIFTWELLRELMEEPLPQLESDTSELGLYLEETGWRDADLDAFLEHIPALSDWIAEYRLPQEEKMQADPFSAIIGYGGGQTFQWIWKDMYTTEPGDSCPEEWKAAAVFFRLDGERLVFDTDGSGTLKDVLSWSNHSGFVTQPVSVEGCEEQAILVQFSCDLFTAAELAEAEEAGTVIPEKDTVGHFWYVCFGREGAPYGYVAGLNMRYFSEEDAVEFAKSIRFTEAAWR